MRISKDAKIEDVIVVAGRHAWRELGWGDGSKIKRALLVAGCQDTDRLDPDAFEAIVLGVIGRESSGGIARDLLATMDRIGIMRSYPQTAGDILRAEMMDYTGRNDQHAESLHERFAS